ncbi:hypothetical protein SKAU_G00326050 [Synaphobranchus kaupii]|uniref:Uncharacterized protein n=1 Tax=Synaphobranchus kaupii TaxID=118154 RepID=A0A9Q1IK15_SYNKA|nr:hypothetical protein SKAU_G00326050 [Synaphobranchus kaupii]
MGGVWKRALLAAARGWGSPYRGAALRRYLFSRRVERPSSVCTQHALRPAKPELPNCKLSPRPSEPRSPALPQAHLCRGAKKENN